MKGSRLDVVYRCTEYSLISCRQSVLVWNNTTYTSKIEIIDTAKRNAMKIRLIWAPRDKWKLLVLATKTTNDINMKTKKPTVRNYIKHYTRIFRLVSYHIDKYFFVLCLIYIYIYNDYSLTSIQLKIKNDFANE